MERSSTVVSETQLKDIVSELKQKLLEFAVHAADVSTQTRTFEIAVEWTKLLFEEFFH